MDERIVALIADAQAAGGRKATTCRWVRASYRSLRTFLLEANAEGRFVRGDARDQVMLLRAWIAWLRQRQMAPSALNAVWRGVYTAFRWANRVDGTLNPCQFVPDPPRVGRLNPEFLPRHAAATVLSFVNTHAWPTDFERARNLAVIGLMMLAGLRFGEVLRLGARDVDTQNETIKIIGGKGTGDGGKERVIYMPPQLLRILRAYEDARENMGRTCGRYLTQAAADRAIGEIAIRTLFKRISAAMQMRVTPHMLRHTFATLCRQADVRDRLAMELLGHTSLAMLQRYSHVEDGEVRAAARQIRLDVNF
ncbi:MAG TPA: site-specific integrase [Thermoanaerobaculia bacterium]|nr:site-specific integrase [Thermoanaerobaculia bacterium]